MAGVRLLACRLTYPVCHAQAPYCLRPLWLHRMFRHYLINGKVFGEKNVTEYKICVLIFPTILFETFLVLRINQQDIVINVKTSSGKVPVIFVTL